MRENPYQSPLADLRSPRDATTLTGCGRYRMALWGLVAGAMTGATFGAIGGGLLGAVFFALVVNNQSETGVGLFGPAEAILVALIAGGTIVGSLWGMLTGAACGPPLAVAAVGLARKRRGAYVLASSMISAIGGATSVVLGSRTMLAQVGRFTNGTGAELVVPLGLLIGIAAGLGAGTRLGRLFWRLAGTRARD